MADLSQINSNLFGSIGNAFKGGSVVNAIGWLLVGIVVLAGIAWYYFYRVQKKTYNKKITAFEIVGSHYEPIYRDVAKTVKLGKGGFEILFLKKLKTWKLAYGGRVGKDTYYFFIGRDGYWYNGLLSAEINTIDKNGGYVQIVTTNPLMRAQYTALEKQIDALHGDKKSFWDKYGNWVLSIGFVLIIGVLAWLIYREMSPLLNNVAGVVEKLETLTDRINQLLVNTNNANNGLVQR